MSARLGAVLAPPHRLWLAGLGGTSLAIRGAKNAWSVLLAEGAATEARLRDLVRRATDT